MTLLHNPYAGVDWGSVTPRVGNSHAHATSQTALDNYYARGIRVFSLTNYYPSGPTCPLEDFFATVPAGTICLPASEQHSYNEYPLLHLCAVGSTLTVAVGADVSWRTGVDDIVADLVDPDGGGVVVAHPIWSYLSVLDVGAMLDYDDRVIGIEAHNFFVETNLDYLPERRLSAIPMWDTLLHSGRKCFGLFVTDHKNTGGTTGRSVLLLPAFTSAAALTAYRNGEFYGAYNGTGLTLTGLDVDPGDDRQITVTTDSATDLRMITGPGVVATETGPVATFTVPAEARYARFEGQNTADTIFTQPLMYDLSRYDLDVPVTYEMTPARRARARAWAATD